MRLTEAIKDDYYNGYYTNGQMSSGIVYINDNKDFTNAAIYKLGQLEDIEEELGIDFILLIKLLNLQETEKPIIIYYKDSSRCKKIREEEFRFIVDIRNKRITKLRYLNFPTWDTVLVYIPSERGRWFKFKDYGKTWALTREELEK